MVNARSEAATMTAPPARARFPRRAPQHRGKAEDDRGERAVSRGIGVPAGAVVEVGNHMGSGAADRELCQAVHGPPAERDDGVGACVGLPPPAPEEVDEEEGHRNRDRSAAYHAGPVHERRQPGPTCFRQPQHQPAVEIEGVAGGDESGENRVQEDRYRRDDTRGGAPTRAPPRRLALGTRDR